MTNHPDAPSGYPHSPPPWDRLPPPNGGDGGGNTKRIVGPVSLAVPQGSPITITPADDSPRWLKIARDVLLSIAALLLIVSWVYAVVAVNRVGNALDEVGKTGAGNSTTQAPAICYIDATDPSCPPGFDPNAGG